jgi:hypothetical protein
VVISILGVLLHRFGVAWMDGWMDGRTGHTRLILGLAYLSFRYGIDEST